MIVVARRDLEADPDQIVRLGADRDMANYEAPRYVESVPERRAGLEGRVARPHRAAPRGDERRNPLTGPRQRTFEAEDMHAWQGSAPDSD
jgi:hypothetical protein